MTGPRPNCPTAILAQDRDRCQAAGIRAEVEFTTKPRDDRTGPMLSVTAGAKITASV